MLHYILQTVAFQVFFLIIYDLFLKNETFFNWNRAYLIGTACLSFILPFLKFESIKAIVPEPMVIRLPEVIIGDVSPTFDNTILVMGSEQITEQAASFSWTYVWIAGMVLAAFILAYKIIKIGRMFYKNPHRWQGDALIVFLMNSSAAFSFFHYIFLGTDISAEKKEHIMQHEMVHVKEKHSWDLLVFEILRIVFWFNPLIYMYQNKLSNLHEFIADAKAVKYKGKSAYYQSLLSQVFETQQISFINPFFKQSLIKKRIVMLSKSKSKQIHLIKYALLVPMVMGMLMYTSSYASEIKDPFPVFQKEVLNQELTFPELVEKYYKEIIGLEDAPDDFYKAYKNYGDIGENYIQSEQEVAKAQALLKYEFTKLTEKKKAVGLNEDEERNLEHYGSKQPTYEEYLSYKESAQGKNNWENSSRDGELRLVVADMKNLTESDKKRRAEKTDLLVKGGIYNNLKMTDGKTTINLDMDKNVSTIIDNIKIEKTSSEANDIEVPYAVIDQPPLFEGCEASGSKDDDKRCTSNMISQFVNKNFNVDLATALGLTGRQRINVIFKIGKDGKVRDVMSRAPHPGLEAEAIRVIKSMPDFTPGKQRGKTVTVPYSLPILFQVQDDAPGTNINNSGEPFVALNEIVLYTDGKVASSNQADKQSSSYKMSQFVTKNFNTSIAKEQNLTGKQRIHVIFKIDANGKITDVQAKAPQAALETEIKRVINAMPDNLLGKQKEKDVSVSYSLPVLFVVPGDTLETDQNKSIDAQEENIEVPYAVVDEVPVFPSCESLESNKDRKQCTSDKVSQFVNKNFNTNLAKELGLTGMQRLTVIFKIGEDGYITDIKARAAHPGLEKEAIRVIEALPKMIPGKQKGKAVVVPYSIPILFQVQ
ncbi:M56 family metallopeptidase [Gelidibacter gilvus]|uniref:BlaR1 peptidase M56 family protein n=1 Tax=Gelidibacter gilvus TaxID=59602 RepID=A0A4Q0XB70_9FLAO|nr:M56 family metallopeptidase [Gelidibacter gilvus]RXJ43776.1 hypothetical protein ESZ48_18705 [Gelidibacter gilvus]